MRFDHDRPQEKVFKISCGANAGKLIRLRKKRTRWHLVSSSKNISYSQSELDDLINTGCLEQRT